MAEEPEEGGVVLNPREFFRQLNTGQFIALAIIVVAGLTLIFSTVYYATQEEMEPLYNKEVDAKTEELITQELTSRQVSYEVLDNGKIMVPKSKVRELRTAFEAMEITPDGKTGMSILDETSPLKAGAQMMKLKAQQALAMDIQRMLEENPNVIKAKVQIVQAKDSPFADQTEPAKASVMLRLKNYADVTREQIRGMQMMVASAIEGASIDDVTITDQYANLLSKTPVDDETMAMNQANLNVKSEMEKDLERKVHQIVETFLGPGRVKARVTLDVDFDQIQTVEKIYGGPDAEGEPQRYSEQSKTENISRSGGIGDAVGTAANTAQGQIPATGETKSSSQIDRDTRTHQYFVDEKMITVDEAPYRIDRMSIALQLDYKETEIETKKPGFFAKLTKTTPDWIETKYEPLSQDEIAQVEELVKGAVGFQEPRGDFLSVQNFAFKPLISKKAQAAMDTGLLLEYINKWTPTLIRLIIFVLFVLFGISLFRRFVAPILQQAQLEEPAISAALPSGPPKTVAELESELEQEIESSIPSTQLSKTEIMKKRLIEMVQQDPETVSGLVRTWLLEDE